MIPMRKKPGRRDLCSRFRRTVPRREAPAVLKASEAREAKEAATRHRLKNGELGLDIYDMRDKLTKRGLLYRPQSLPE